MTERRSKILILATGGTIAGAQRRPGEHGYDPGKIRVEDLIESVPEARALAEISGEQLMNVASQDIRADTWLALADQVGRRAISPEVDERSGGSRHRAEHAPRTRLGASQRRGER